MRVYIRKEGAQVIIRALNGEKLFVDAIQHLLEQAVTRGMTIAKSRAPVSDPSEQRSEMHLRDAIVSRMFEPKVKRGKQWLQGSVTGYETNPDFRYGWALNFGKQIAYKKGPRAGRVLEPYTYRTGTKRRKGKPTLNWFTGSMKPLRFFIRSKLKGTEAMIMQRWLAETSAAK